MNPDEKKLVRGAIEEMIDSMHRAAAERDLQKEIVARIKEETTVTPRVFRRMAKVAFNSSYSQEAALNDEFESLYEEVLYDNAQAA